MSEFGELRTRTGMHAPNHRHIQALGQEIQPSADDPQSLGKVDRLLAVGGDQQVLARANVTVGKRARRPPTARGSS